MSSKDTRVHLDNGNFDRFFDLLKKDRDYWQLCVFLGMCMGIGVTITKKQLGYVKRVWKEVDPTQMFHGLEQIELALNEYKSGEPYRLRDFDSDGALEPDLYAKEDTALTGTKGTKDTKEVKTKGKQKHSNENVENMEEHASKRTKV